MVDITYKANSRYYQISLSWSYIAADIGPYLETYIAPYYDNEYQIRVLYLLKFAQLKFPKYSCAIV